MALEPWPPTLSSNNEFPCGWTNDKFYMAAVSPQAFPIPGTPTSWTPGTNGLVRGEVVLVTETTEEDLKKYAGKLKGKWILTQAAPDVAGLLDRTRLTRDTPRTSQRMELARPAAAPAFGVARIADAAGRGQARRPRRRRRRRAFNRNAWFKTEGVAGLLSTAPRGHGIYTIGGGDRAGGSRAAASRGSRSPPSSTAAWRGWWRRTCR